MLGNDPTLRGLHPCISARAAEAEEGGRGTPLVAEEDQPDEPPSGEDGGDEAGAAGEPEPTKDFSSALPTPASPLVQPSPTK